MTWFWVRLMCAIIGALLLLAGYSLEYPPVQIIGVILAGIGGVMLLIMDRRLFLGYLRR